jgi:hypothetical protein
VRRGAVNSVDLTPMPTLFSKRMGFLFLPLALYDSRFTVFNRKQMKRGEWVSSSIIEELVVEEVNV